MSVIVPSRVTQGLNRVGGSVKNMGKRAIAETISTVGLIGVAGASILASRPSGSMPQADVSPLAYAGLGLGVLSFLDNAVQWGRDPDVTANTFLGCVAGVGMITSGLCVASGARPAVSIGFAVVTAGTMAARWLAQLKKDEK